MNRAQRRKAESEFRRRPPDRYGYIVISSDDLVARPPPDLAEVVKAAGVDPNTPFNGLPSPWKRNDAEWFKAHPQRAHRVREQFPGEQFDLASSGRVDKVIVRQIRLGLRVRAPFTVTECDALTFDPMLRLIERGKREEAVAHALFDLTQTKGRLIQVDEIVAMVGRFESASARAKS